MKTFLFCLLALLTNAILKAQSSAPDAEIQRNLEDLASREDVPSEDDSYWQALDHLAKHPLDLNQATLTELEIFSFLTPIQISTFIAYRARLGKLISVYELQAVPGWDPETIRKMKSFIVIAGDG